MMRPLRLIGLTSLVVFAGCSKDEQGTGMGQSHEEGTGIEARPYVTEYEEMYATRTWEAPTRAAWTPPSPYVSYNDLTHKGLNQKDLSLESIGVFFSKDDAEPMEGIFFYQNSKWHLKNKDNEDVNAGDYYLYGYIPREDAKSASIVPNGTYSNGAVLTIKELNSLTQSDVCIIVGAKEGTDDQTVTGLQTGSFLTHLNPTSGVGNHNYIFLLFEHLYSALRFNFTIDASYADLRTIKIRKLELVSYSDDNGGIVRAKYDAVITLQKTTGASPIVGNVHFIPDENSAPVAPKEIYNWHENPANYVTLTTSTPSTFMACFVPGENTYFKLRTTYDVFDREDVLIRQECQAENTIDLRNSFDQALLSASRGHCFSYTIKVQPTYAYQLSNNDIDNPELKISE